MAPALDRRRLGHNLLYGSWFSGSHRPFLLEALDLGLGGLGLLQESLQRLAAAKRGRPGTGADAHAILGDAVQIDQALLTQHLHGMLEQRFQELGVVGTEIGERVIVDGNPSGKPAERVVMETQNGDLARTGKTSEGGIQPQGDEQTRIDGRSTGNAAPGANEIVPRREVQSLDVIPDVAGGMVFFNELIDGHGRKDLLAIRDRQTRWCGEVGHSAGRGRGRGHGGANRTGLGLRRGARRFDSSGGRHRALFGLPL